MPINDAVTGTPRFYRPGRLSARRAALLRVLAVAVLMGIALGGHWIDRTGLRDNTDGQTSFTDVVYFTAITVTTVGYGDIVPVTPRARMFDTFVVTPIRIFVWLIFLGSAYSFLLRQGWERWRMGIIQKRLSGHTIVCGFGTTGSASVAELLGRGAAPESIVVIDPAPDNLRRAEQQGVATVEGDATHNAVLKAAGIERAGAMIVTTGRDDTAILVALSARRLAPGLLVSIGIRASENEAIAREAGADVIINLVSLSGRLLAGSTQGPKLADYVSDLVTRHGQVELRERVITNAEVGHDCDADTRTRIVRIQRGDAQIGFWEDGARSLQAGDRVIEIVPRPAA